MNKLDTNYDYLTLLVKREKLEEVKQRYQVFSWEILKIEEHSVFGNIMLLKMRRPHKIKDKDKLQYLQVQMEFLLNEQEKLQKFRHKKSTIIGLTWGIMCALIFALSILTILYSTGIIWIVAGILFSIIGLVLSITISIIVFNLVKSEKVYYTKERLLLKKQIDDICLRVTRSLPNESEVKNG